MKELLTVATTNAKRGLLLENPENLTPFTDAGVDVLLLQEVERKKHNFENLGQAGFQVVLEANDLAIAINPDTVNYHGSRTDVLQKRRFFGENHEMIAATLQKEGVIFTAATLHPDVFARAHARVNQNRYMARRLKNPFYDGVVIIGGDFNHFPRPTKRDMRIRKKARLTSIKLDRPTYPIWKSKHAKLRFLPFKGAELDAMMYRGQGVEEVENNVVDVESDHRAIITVFSLVNLQQK